MERVTLSHGFGPFYDEHSRVLILGSFPSVKSREAQFYYGHPQNRFWRVLAAVYGGDVPASPDEKKAFLAENGIALYDVIESCSIIGSADSTIEDVVVTDLAPILAAGGIGGRIFTNGAKAYELYRRYTYPKTGIAATKLPSTSPANAAFSLDRLAAIWRAALLPR